MYVVGKSIILSTRPQYRCLTCFLVPVLSNNEKVLECFIYNVNKYFFNGQKNLERVIIAQVIMSTNNVR